MKRTPHFRGSFRGVFLFLLILAAVIAGCIRWTATNKPLPEGQLEIHFLDVGQGDASFIVTPNGCALIDTGEADAAQSVYFAINSYGNHLDYLIISHAHTDHMGGAAYILEKMSVDTVVLPRTGSFGQSYVQFLDAVSESGASVLFADPGLQFSLGDARFTVLAPLLDYENENDTSAVIRLDFGEVSALFTGDAERESELDQTVQYGTRRGGKLDVDILKVPHHGSDTSSSIGYLKAVTPEIAVISCGRDNAYGHPHTEVLTRLKALAGRVLRTDEDGTVILVTDGETVVEKEQK